MKKKKEWRLRNQLMDVMQKFMREHNLATIGIQSARYINGDAGFTPELMFDEIKKYLPIKDVADIIDTVYETMASAKKVNWTPPLKDDVVNVGDQYGIKYMVYDEHTACNVKERSHFVSVEKIPLPMCYSIRYRFAEEEGSFQTGDHKTVNDLLFLLNSMNP
jgi:hypothetical protein